MQGLRVRVLGISRVWVCGFRIIGFRVSGLGLQVLGSRF